MTVKKEDNSGLKVHEPKNPPGKQDHEKHHRGEAGPARNSRIGILALLVALIALFLVLHDRWSSRDDAMDVINQMITDTVVPGVKKASEHDVIGHIYDLKRVIVTLEEVKETSTNQEIKAMVDKLRKEIEELNVKLLVHE